MFVRPGQYAKLSLTAGAVDLSRTLSNLLIVFGSQVGTILCVGELALYVETYSYMSRHDQCQTSASGACVTMMKILSFIPDVDFTALPPILPSALKTNSGPLGMASAPFRTADARLA